MLNKLGVSLGLLFVIPGLVLTPSCSKKVVKSKPSTTQATKDESALQASQRAIDEERCNEKHLRQARYTRRASRHTFISEDIYFEFDSSILSQAARRILAKKAVWLRHKPDVTAIIEGHCDERGTNAYNLALGDRRAQRAKTYMTWLGISASRLNTISYGEERPVDTGHNGETWAKNRRVHFAIEKK